MTLIASASARRRQGPGPIVDMSTPMVDSTVVAVFVNQSGYSMGRSKVATVTNTADNTPAVVKNAETGAIVASVPVAGGRIDLSMLDTSGTYRIECNGAISHNFRVGKYWNQRVSAGPALAFMNEARSDTFEEGRNGIAWRDSHQFSFEMHGLVDQYAANPAAFTRMPLGIVSAATCEYVDLRSQTEPDIIWLMKFAAHRYVDLAAGGTLLHGLTKGQLPIFLWLYPHISQWVPLSLYESVRDVVVAQWATTTSNLYWYTVANSNNMYEVQVDIGPAKGSEPPGHRILPNLLMWEVAVRDGLTGAAAFLDAAKANAAWLVGLDITNPLYTKNQRMSEHITMTGLCHLYEKYPEHAPTGTAAFIEQWADLMLARSDNLWDFRMYTSAAAGDAADRWTNIGDGGTPGGGGYNEPGNIAGLPASLIAARRVITNETTRAALLRLADAQFDQVFGRNPLRRHYCYAAASEFEGVDVGWWNRYVGGAGALGSVTGVLDGAPIEGAYPFDPTLTGYVEGWVAFNSAWNHALAYDAAEDVEVAVLQGGSPIASAAQGSTVTLRLRAPLNFDEAAIESGWVEVSVDGGTPAQVTVTEASADDWYFTAAWTVPAGSSFTVGYGYGLFRREVTIEIL